MSDIFEMAAAGQSLLSPAETGRITVIGAGARDLHLKDEVRWPNYRPGEKGKFEPDDYTRLEELTDKEYEMYLGGNALNTATALAAWGHLTRFVGVLSHIEDPDPTSNLIREHLGVYGIEDCTRERHNYQVSTSVVMYDKQDQHSRGKKRGSMYEALDANFLRKAMYGSSIIAFASLKDPNLNRRVLGITTEMPQGTFVAANISRSEIEDHTQEVRSAMQIRRLDLLALNEAEIGLLYGSKKDPETLTAEVSKEDVRFVLTTCGEKGVLLGHNGEVWHAPAAKIEPQNRIYTLGAGDRAHALALSGLTRGIAPENIPKLVALGTLPVLQTIGAHGDLKPLHR